jgi:GlpG protein
MRKLCEADSPQKAARIVDGLLVEGIEAQVRPEGGAEVWVIEHDKLEAAREYAASVADEDAESIARRAKEIRRKRDLDEANHAQRVHDMGARWRGISGLGLGPVTILLIVGSVIIALLGYFAPADANPMWSLTIDHYASTEPLQRVREGEWWRLLTPMFLHFGLFHLVFNMMWVRSLGPQVEANHGSVLMVVLVVVGELAGNLGQYWVSGPAFGGMSGVVYALFGFVWMSARYDRRHRYVMSDTNTVLMMGWFVACATGWLGPIANIGHAGGLVVGLLFGVPAYVRDRRAAPVVVKGTWADVQLPGFRGWRRRYFDPYAPLWFLLLAAVVIGAEYR